jgi:VIT1/CCC1 family predicted Fe2+/Mn2+ transporter
VTVQGGDDLTTMLWATVGCSLAWGLVDGAMYVFGNLASRNRSYYLLRRLRDDPAAARSALVASVPSAVADVVPPSRWDEMVAVLSRVPVPSRARAGRDDLLGGVAIFFLANAALLPLAAPFVVIDDLDLAQHVSNAVALVLLFGAGHQLARYTGERPLRVALRFVAFGLVLIAATLALGG